MFSSIVLISTGPAFGSRFRPEFGVQSDVHYRPAVHLPLVFATVAAVVVFNTPLASATDMGVSWFVVLLCELRLFSLRQRQIIVS